MENGKWKIGKLAMFLGTIFLSLALLTGCANAATSPIREFIDTRGYLFDDTKELAANVEWIDTIELSEGEGNELLFLIHVLDNVLGEGDSALFLEHLRPISPMIAREIREDQELSYAVVTLQILNSDLEVLAENSHKSGARE